MKTVDDTFVALRDQIEELRALVAPLDEGQLSLPSACAGWQISDVLLHLAQTNDMATASARGELAVALGEWIPAGAAVRTDIDDLAGDAVARSRGPSGIAVRDRWVESAEGMIAALESCVPTSRVQWVAGDMAPRTLATTRIAETWIHTGDVCSGLEVQQPASDRIWHIARLVHRTLPYAFARAGLAGPGDVRFELSSPVDASSVWRFGPDDAPTVIVGPAIELCLVAGQRMDAETTKLAGSGPDADVALRVMRTYA